MPLASAYPNSAISTGAMIAIAVVMASVLAFWLVMVFVADRTKMGRQTRTQSARRAPEPAVAVAGPALSGPDETAEDEASEAGRGDARRIAA